MWVVFNVLTSKDKHHIIGRGEVEKNFEFKISFLEMNARSISGDQDSTVWRFFYQRFRNLPASYGELCENLRHFYVQ